MTTLLYLQEHPSPLSHTSSIVSASLRGEEDSQVMILVVKETPFHPQGGGQETDIGSITINGQTFTVTGVAYNADDRTIVEHICTTKASDDSIPDTATLPGALADLRVDPEHRMLQNRLHTAGHLISVVVRSLDYTTMGADEDYSPGEQIAEVRGFHMARGPYVEYAGLPVGLDRAAFKTAVADGLKVLVDSNVDITVQYLTPEAMQERCAKIHVRVPMSDAVRCVFVAEELGLPCGGTHTSTSGEVGEVVIRKLKKAKKNLRIAYKV
eukprot:gnl/Dysnectes_brevis/3218_a4023_1392.p1 GENE.gnl/Dysnectes_brevis/3218_a4023_1392~~gnl/Dysnectes_brevis/3218_a4023_1392.p1  ORF type:complete len:278 (-),score=34.88 gnl/Dysnectes_brevis/3218_a4023_1392:92-895(-)